MPYHGSWTTGEDITRYTTYSTTSMPVFTQPTLYGTEASVESIDDKINEFSEKFAKKIYDILVKTTNINISEEEFIALLKENE